jgi:malate synthase
MLHVTSPLVDIQVLGKSDSPILTRDALTFVGFLCAKFEARRQALLEQRNVLAKSFDAGNLPTFLADPQIENPSWRCAPIPKDLEDRRVEITGPVDRKMIINGLNSGASTFMADFEDSTSPVWTNMLDGQLNLRDAVLGTISYTHPKTGKIYKLNKKTAVLLVRPRGWHLNEAHFIVNGKEASGSLVDFGLYFFHNVSNLREKGSGPYFYLPKLENHQEAKLWNDVFIAAQQYLGVPLGTIRATVLLETITAAFEMEEILYQLREHSIGLNCGRWDYLFSYIKKFKTHPDKITPDRSFLTMTTPLMKAYVTRLIQVCHRRGTFAMGGMSAVIPIKNDISRNDVAMNNVKQDKLREVKAGHDGTWVAHPDLVKVARQVFDEHMPWPNQIFNIPNNCQVTASDLLQLPKIDSSKAITSASLKHGIAIVLAYTEAWLRGIGCIPLNNFMEDAATAEISRAQIWQWRHHGVETADDRIAITSERLKELVQQEVSLHAGDKWKLAGKLVTEMLTANEFDDFLTSVCYPYIIDVKDENSLSKL